MDQDLLRIGEFAKRAETNLRTLRYYEELRLIEPASRSEGGFRYYHVNQLDRINAIRRLKDLGLSLKEIADALTIDRETEPKQQAVRLRVVLEHQMNLVEDKIRHLQDDLDELRNSHRKLLEVCQSCEQNISQEECDPCPRDGQPMPAILRALL